MCSSVLHVEHITHGLITCQPFVAIEVIVLTESEKFSRHGTVPLNLKDQVKTVITDQMIGEQIATELGERGIEVLTS